MRCTTARTIMVSQLDGEASGAEKERLERHLEDCGACRLERASLGRLGLALEVLRTPVAVPPTLEDDLVRRVRMLADEESPSWGERLRSWLPGPMLAAVAVAILVVVGLRTEDANEQLASTRALNDLQGTLPRSATSPDSLALSARTSTTRRSRCSI